MTQQNAHRRERLKRKRAESPENDQQGQSTAASSSLPIRLAASPSIVPRHKFPGTITIQGSREDPVPPSNKANRWKRHVSSVERMVIAMFVDGSFKSRAKPSGYGMAYRRVSPGTADNGTLVTMRSQVRRSKVLDSQFVETVAFLAAVRRMKFELVENVAKRLAVLWPRTGRLKVIAKIFSDNQRMLRRLIDNLDPTNQAGLIYARLTDEIVDESHDLIETLAKWGVDVELEGHWCPAHTGLVDIHTQVDFLAKQAKQAQKNPGRYARMDGKPLRPCPPCVYTAALEEELIKIYHSSPLIRSTSHSTGPGPKRVRISSPEPEIPKEGWDEAVSAAYKVYCGWKIKGRKFGHNEGFVFVGEGNGRMWRVGLVDLQNHEKRQQS